MDLNGLKIDCSAEKKKAECCFLGSLRSWRLRGEVPGVRFNTEIQVKKTPEL
jgi:hypothetical protein